MTAVRLCPEKGCRREIRGNILWRHLEREHGYSPKEAREKAATAKRVDTSSEAIREALRTIERALRDRGAL